MAKNMCCWINQNKLDEGCLNDAVWEIHDIDNPNPLENDTYSCNKHLVEMLFDNNTVSLINPLLRKSPPEILDIESREN